MEQELKNNSSDTFNHYEMYWKNDDYQLINTITESVMFRSKKQLMDMDLSKLSELIYLYSLVMFILSKEDRTERWARMYASRTSTFRSFNLFRSSGTDLYLAVHQLTTSDDGQKIYPRFMVSSYLNFLIPLSKSMDKNFAPMLYQMEAALKIKKNLLSKIRRRALSWEELTDETKLKVLQLMIRELRSISNKAEPMSAVKVLKKEYTNKIKNKKKDKSKGGAKRAAMGAAAGFAAGAATPYISSKFGGS